MTVEYQITEQAITELGDDLAQQFSHGDYEGVCARLLAMPTPEASALTAHIVLRLLGFQHRTAVALRDALVRRAVS